jgi:hypothetical protein
MEVKTLPEVMQQSDIQTSWLSRVITPLANPSADFWKTEALFIPLASLTGLACSRYSINTQAQVDVKISSGSFYEHP